MLTRTATIKWTGAFIAGFTAAAALLAAVPAIYAQTGRVNAETRSAASVEAEESIVISPSDDPLTRAAKLRRAWVVYRESGSSQIWAVTDDGKKREVMTLDFFKAFNANYRVQLVEAGALEGLTVGDPITSATGLDPADFRKRPFGCRLVKSSDSPAVYLLCHGRKRVILREGVFHRFGWEFRDVEEVPKAELDETPTGAAIDESTAFSEDINVESTDKRMDRERLTKRLDLRGKVMVRARLVKAIGRPDIYIITPDGKRRHIRDIRAAERHGIDVTAVTEVTVEELEAFPEGEEISAEGSGTGLDATVNTSVR